MHKKIQMLQTHIFNVCMFYVHGHKCEIKFNLSCRQKHAGLLWKCVSERKGLFVFLPSGFSRCFTPGRVRAPQIIPQEHTTHMFVWFELYKSIYVDVVSPSCEHSKQIDERCWFSCQDNISIISTQKQWRWLKSWECVVRYYLGLLGMCFWLKAAFLNSNMRL